jgi:hypothetical protein
MTLIAPASGVDGAFNTTFAQAGMAQITASNIPVPIVTSLLASGVWSSGLILNDGFRYLSVGVTMSQAGTLVVNQFIDTAGLVARTPISNTVVASTPLLIDVSDLKPFLAFTLVLTNTSVSTATVSGFAVLLSAG